MKSQIKISAEEAAEEEEEELILKQHTHVGDFLSFGSFLSFWAEIRKAVEMIGSKTHVRAHQGSLKEPGAHAHIRAL